jgi:hypothetical protein
MSFVVVDMMREVDRMHVCARGRAGAVGCVAASGVAIESAWLIWERPVLCRHTNSTRRQVLTDPDRLFGVVGDRHGLRGCVGVAALARWALFVSG